MIGEVAEREITHAHAEREDKENQRPKVTARLEFVSSIGEYFDKVGEDETLQWVRSCATTFPGQRLDFFTRGGSFTRDN